MWIYPIAALITVLFALLLRMFNDLVAPVPDFFAGAMTAAVYFVAVRVMKR